jgi:hypothetical protein
VVLVLMQGSTLPKTDELPEAGASLGKTSCRAVSGATRRLRGLLLGTPGGNAAADTTMLPTATTLAVRLKS